MIHRWLIPFLLLGCDPNGSGVSVGNPNKNTLLRVAPPGAGLELFSADLTVVSVTGIRGDIEQSIPGPAATDVLAGVTLGVPAGTWQQLRVDLDGVFTLTGTDQGGDLDLQLEVPQVEVSVSRLPLELDEPHVFELAFPGWLTAEEVGWTPGDDHVVRPADPLHDHLVMLIADRSSVFGDPDGDGERGR